MFQKKGTEPNTMTVDQWEKIWMEENEKVRKDSMKKLYKNIIRRNGNTTADIDEPMSYFQFKEYITQCVIADEEQKVVFSDEAEVKKIWKQFAPSTTDLCDFNHFSNPGKWKEERKMSNKSLDSKNSKISKKNLSKTRA